MCVRFRMSKIGNFFGKVGSFLNHPRTALCIMVSFLIGYFIYANFGGAFTGKFLRFGPDTTSEPDKTTNFMGIKLNNWKNVIIVYVVMFMVTVLQSYYGNVVGQNLHSFVWNRAVKIVPYPKFWTYLIYLIDPFIGVCLKILNFYAIATFELQYIIPQFVGEYLTDTPFMIAWLRGKKFIS